MNLDPIAEAMESSWTLRCGRCKVQDSLEADFAKALIGFSKQGWAEEIERKRVLCPDCVSDIRGKRP